MYICGKSMKGNVTALLDNCVSGVDEVSLVIAINSFLTVPASFDEARSIYTELLDMCSREEKSIDEPLQSRLLIEVRDVSPAVITEKMRNYSLSIRRILSDSIASSLVRCHNTLLGHIRDAVNSNSAADILALADNAVLTVPEPDKKVTPILCPRRA